MAQQELSDDDIFGPQPAQELNDADVFGPASGSADRGPARPAPGADGPTQPVPGAQALDDYLTTAGKGVFDIPRYVGEGQQQDVEAFTRAPPKDIPGEILDTLTRTPRQLGAGLSFLTRPIIGTAAKGISALSGEFFTPEQGETALMGLKGTPEAPWFPREGPMRDVTPRAPRGAPRLETPQKPPGTAASADLKPTALVPTKPGGPTIDQTPKATLPPAATGVSPKIGKDDYEAFPKDKNGATDLKAWADTVVARVDKALQKGGTVTLHADGKPIQIVSIKNGMMQDAKGQRWGTMAIASDVSGKNFVEISPAQTSQRAAVNPDLDPEAAYSVEANRGQVAVLDKKIARAKEALDELGPTAAPDVQATLRQKLTQWTEERDALAGLGAELTDAEIFQTAGPKPRGKKGVLPPASAATVDAGIVPPSRGPGVGTPPPPVPPSQGAGGGVPPRRLPKGALPPPPIVSPGPPRRLPPLPEEVRPGLYDMARRRAQNVEQILSPTTVDDSAQLAEALHRASSGKAARDTATAEASVQQYRRQVGKLSENERYDFIDHMEGVEPPVGLDGHPIVQVKPELRPLADVLRNHFQNIRLELENLPPAEKMRFVDEYFPHQWKNDPKTLAEFYNKHGIGKEGSNWFVKGRSLPTVSDGLRAGLRLKDPNPINAALSYIENAKRFIAQARIYDYGRTHDLSGKVVKEGKGFIKFYLPGKQSEGMVELSGRFGGKLSALGQMRAYAPEGFARIYNNAISRKFTGPEGEIINGLQRTSNFVTAVELGLSPFHGMTMSQEAMVSGVAKAAHDLLTGHPIMATKALGAAITNPVRYAMTGGKMQRAYTGQSYKNPGYEKATSLITPNTQHIYKIVDLLEQAGGRAVKMDREYLGTRKGSYVEAFKNARLKNELMDTIKDMKKRPLVGTIKAIAENVARIMDTVSGPMFQEWIPRLKLGAFEEHMSGWLKRNPNATGAQQVAAAREIWDSVDNRFGEMVRDNIFWDNKLKQLAQAELRSFTWSFGSAREIAGGLWDFGKQPWKAAQLAGKLIDGKPVVPKDMPRFTQRMAYVIALPLVFATYNAVGQYLFTGEAPKDLDDLKAGRTGGATPKGKPERFVAPGFMKDVFGYYKDPVHEFWNKTATFPRTAIEIFLNRDWRGLPIAPDRYVNIEGQPSTAQAYGEHILENFGPFGLKNMIKGPTEGSNLGGLPTFLGMQPAGQFYADPDYEDVQRKYQTGEWIRKLKADAREESKYKGPQ